MKTAKVSVKGKKGDWKVFIKDRYGTNLYSGRKHKTKKSALEEFKRAKRWVKY